MTGGSGAGVTGSNIFSEQLFYEQTDPLVQSAPRWGGDVSGMMWAAGAGEEGGGTAGEPVPHRYAFVYDGAGRLTRASYRGPEGRYGRETEYGYDRNGNVTQLIRNERNAADSLVSRRNLTLTYNGNRLAEVNAGTRLTPSEANPVTPPTGPVHPGLNPEVGPVVPGVGVEEPIVSVTLPQLAYYPDGSLKYDDYGEIVNIEYNALKLPSKVNRGIRVIPSGIAYANDDPHFGEIRYGYSADGVKLRREERNANPDMTFYPPGHFTTDYVGNCIWRGETLATVMTEGGYINALDGSYHFVVTDHLGNVRAIMDGSGTIEKSFDYYPFGESYASETVSNPGEAFRYGGKEREEKFGIHEVYDFSARWYSPVYGRFQTMDPLCEKYYSLSPYAYCANNPMRFVDPSGMVIDAVWDLLNVALDVVGLAENIKQRRWKDAVLDAGGLLLDASAAALPFVPAGAGAALKTARTGDKVYDAAKIEKFLANVARGRETEKRILTSENMVKNTKMFAATTKERGAVNVIPDAIHNGKVIEIKDVAKLSFSKQIEGEMHLAEELGYEFVLYVPKDAHLSNKLLGELAKPRRSFVEF